MTNLINASRTIETKVDFNTVQMVLNSELNGVELYFNGKPSEAVRTLLKSNGYRWSARKKAWYAKQNADTLQVAKNISNNNIMDTAPTKATNKGKKSNTTLTLWDAVQWENLNLTMEQKEAECKVIAKEIRTHIRKRFPQCKFSVTVPYYGKINFDIKASPYEKDSVYLEAIKKYCENLLDAYKHTYSPADSMTDYAGHYNFYGWVDVAYNYEQTETNEAIEKDMKLFDAELEKFEQAEEERKELEYQEWKKEQEKRDVEYKQRQEEEAKQVENIYDNVVVNELDDNNQYFVVGSEFADLNKNNTLEQYKEEVATGDYTLNNVKITKEIHFNTAESLENFSNMLLNDFDFLANTGGSYTDDARINSMTDFYNMDDMERSTVEFVSYGVAVYYSNELQFIVDAQGYNYARYVGLVDNATIQKEYVFNQVLSDDEIKELKLQADYLEDYSTMVIEELGIFGTWEKEHWSEYKNGMKAKLKEYDFKLNKRIIQQLDIEEMKVAMYKLLSEIDGIQDQFKDAHIEQGEKITLYYINDWGMMTESRVIFDSVTNEKYAQYNNAIKLTFTPQGKRKMYSNYFYSTMLVYRGWYELPKTVLHDVEETNGMRVTRTKYGSCDRQQYDDILRYFEQQGLKPIVNTHKNTF